MGSKLNPKGLGFRITLSAFIILFYRLDAVEPFHQHFSLQNYTLQYPYAVHERIPVTFLIIIAVLAPAVIIAIYTLLIDGIFSHRESRSGGKRTRPYTFKQRLWELNCGILGLGLSVSAAFTITGALKNAIGKPRPDLIDRCQPPPGSVDPPMYGLSTHSICTQTDNDILKDGFRSFPSGHSSSAFAGLFYLSIYLAAKLHVLDSKGEVWKSFIVLVPTLAAALVAGSRIMDARHHPFDVITGSMLGTLTAWGSYRQYFPPVSETWRKGRAYPIRSWGKQPKAPEYALRDEERDSNDSTTALDGAAHLDTHGGNVFRAQIDTSQSERNRRNGLQQRKGSQEEPGLPYYNSPSIDVTPASPKSDDPNRQRSYRSTQQELWTSDDETAEGYELREQGHPPGHQRARGGETNEEEGRQASTVDHTKDKQESIESPQRRFSFEPAR
ncbi:PAP2-domain-containing protein [Eremomyces bilateralis CBS 781.70]|uniref:PAP2-domain-containing protein n=1 Tax=Eremomyces bilateralis CBS 781.70 TaxID=1392243 RepID=A0A6G1FXJ1_9PEZI|nr:PAP2-domain-containing protein [Eremomyces bilateralis CBS 781.70]KAF1810468.1 PAP2-domain-containing protein [Eremomyces bilateralis CBS 781.70]